MKKEVSLVFVVLLAVGFLSACSGKKAGQAPVKKTTTQTSTIVKTTATTVSMTEETTTTASTAPSTSMEEPANLAMNIEAVAQGDYRSIVGVWRNGQGQTLTFDENGPVGDSHFINHGEIKDGIYSTGLAPNDGVGGIALIMLPKGVAYPGPDVVGDMDVSDINQDRMLGGHQLILGDNANFYYRVTE